MIIHKTDKYIITVRGNIAEKTDGHTVRRSKFYPERDISAIAGMEDEKTAWQILYDISGQLINNNPISKISPAHIFIDNQNFILSEWSESIDSCFCAPEGYEPIWALGATVFMVFLGCKPFQGQGGKGQSSTTLIPTLRRELPQLSELIARCLSFFPENRPSVSEILKISKENLIRCNSAQKPRQYLKPDMKSRVNINELDKYWPEKF